MVQRSDGALYWAGTTPLTTSSDTPFIAASTPGSFSATIGSSYLACAIDPNGAVWCAGSNSEGQLGAGLSPSSVSSSTIPEEVVTSVGGPALANIVQVSVDGDEGYAACAVDTSGNVWCWGYGYYGVIGNGYENNSTFAVPVMVGGAQLTGVTQISVAYDHACALKSDGTLWCWGYNYYGQIGQGTSGSGTYEYYLAPVQVQALYNDVTGVSVGVDFSCALTSDTTVSCWGYNGSGVLGNGTATGTATVPAQVLTAASGGTAFSGVLEIQVGSWESNDVCALKSGGALWCWGSGVGSTYVPAPYVQSSFPVTDIYLLCSNGAGGPSFLDDTGSFNYENYKPTQISCP